MRPVSIPNTDLTVSNLCLGGGGLGTRTPVGDACRLIDRFVDMGGNFIDTAHVYAAWIPGEGGTSERTIGEWFRRSKNRDGLLVMSKGGHPDLDTMQVSRLSRADIEKDLDESLDRLGIDTIDVYLMHRDDPKIPAGEIIEVLADARKAGKIRWYGVSNWSVDRLREASDYTKANGLPDIAVNQLHWSLATSSLPSPDPTTFAMDPATHAYHTETGLFAAAYSPQAGGFFTRELSPHDIEMARDSTDSYQRAYYTEENYGRLKRAQELASKYGVSPNAIALASLIHQPFPSSAIVGCGTIEHLEDSAQAGDVPLTEAEARWLEHGE